jgi:Asp-tRNA(Asn)/Glu-tRNA(Gln) amidotransferase C subunit
MAEASRDEIALLARHAGLALSEPHLDELVEAARHIAAMVARLAKAASGPDEPAQVFVPGHLGGGHGDAGS